MMSKWFLPIDVMIFELRRSMTVGRLTLWGILVAFPVAIVTIMATVTRMNMGERFSPDRLAEPFGMAMYYLIPEVTCLLGLLLWATPAISTEIEGQTWVYLTLRSSGRSAVVIGKYLTAVFWTMSAALTAATLSSILVGSIIGWRIWGVLCLLSILSCLVHAALYMAIGTVFYRRTMVAAVVYTIIMEYVVSFIPALVNKFTIHYRLRGLLANWMQWDEAMTRAQNIFGNEPVWVHLAVLAATVGIMMTIALYRVAHTEYPTQQTS